ncbi:MAG: hypothetical protein AAF420_09575, partial [Pseudomonadota bacterium]
MTLRKLATIPLICLLPVVGTAQSSWPEALDFDFNYRNSAIGDGTTPWLIRLGASAEIEPTFTSHPSFHSISCIV